MRRLSMRGRSRGFTLLEVIVAFAMLALALTVLLGAMSGATRQVRYADRASHAALHAQSLMAQFGVGETLTPGRREGRIEDSVYRWTLDVTPYIDPLDKRPATLTSGGRPMQLLQLDLTLRWGEHDNEGLRWQTLRLVPAGES